MTANHAVVVDPAEGIIRNCDLSGWEVGIKINSAAEHVIEGCKIMGNYWGAHISQDDACPTSAEDPKDASAAT